MWAMELNQNIRRRGMQFKSQNPKTFRMIVEIAYPRCGTYSDEFLAMLNCFEKHNWRLQRVCPFLLFLISWKAIFHFKKAFENYFC